MITRAMFYKLVDRAVDEQITLQMFVAFSIFEVKYWNNGERGININDHNWLDEPPENQN